MATEPRAARFGSLSCAARPRNFAVKILLKRQVAKTASLSLSTASAFKTIRRFAYTALMPNRQTSHRAGAYRRQPTGYSAFVPAPFPPTDLDLDTDFYNALSRADRALARLDGAASVLPAVDLFISMYVFQEATLSSQIEGTEASLGDVVGAQAEETTPARRDAVAEIENYVRALNYGLERLVELPVSLRLVREIHSVLMTDVRGGESVKTPGEFRRSPNWIGGTNPENARFVPPPVDEMKESLDQWEASIHGTDLPPLVHIGLVHAQFETIHPFLDGNGRVGRLLITFLLTEREILAHPLLYLSIFFKQHQDEYYARLQSVRDHGDWEGWLRFFVDGVWQTARSATETVQSILQLREKDRNLIQDALGRRAGSGLALHDRLFHAPAVNAKQTESALNVSQPTANKLLRELEEAGILREWTGKRRGQSWIYDEYFNIFVDAKLGG